MEGAEASAPQLAIRRIEQKYRALVDSLSEGVWAVDVRGGTTFANRQLGSILGYSMEDMREKTLADFLQPADIATLFGPARDVPRQAERTLAAADGRRVTVLLSTAPLTDGTGAFSGLVATIVDITERRMLEAREEMTRAAAAAIGDSLDENDTARRLASALVQSFADWVLIALADPDAEGAAASFALHRDPAQQGVVDAIAAYPARCAALSGPAVTNGRPVLLSPITPAIIEAQTGDDAYRRLIAAADAHSAVIVPIRNGTRTNLGAFVCVRTGSRPAFIVDDVACLERVAGRAALVIENARLFRAAQEASRRKDEFIARFSHELRTPLTAILGWTRILQGRSRPCGPGPTSGSCGSGSRRQPTASWTRIPRGSIKSCGTS